MGSLFPAPRLTYHQCLLVGLIIMKIILVVVYALLGAALSSGQEEISIKNIIPDFLVEGQCPTVDEKSLWEQQKPNHELFAGKWYEVALTKNPYQLVKECTHSNLTYNEKGFEHVTMGLGADGKFLRRDGVTNPFTTGAHTSTPHLAIQFDMPSFAAPFVILDTDYKSYACIYSCMDFNGGYLSDFGFIWSRNPDIPGHQCKDAFAKISVDAARFQAVKQGDDCNYDMIQSHLLSESLYTKTEL